MSLSLKLLKLIQTEVIPDIQKHMDRMFAIVSNGNFDLKDEEELSQTQQLHEDFKEVVDELERGELEEDEILDWIESIENMRDNNGKAKV